MQHKLETSRRRIIQKEDAEMREGRRSLGMALGDLRKNLSGASGSLILADRESARLCPGDFTTDVAEFEAALQNARRVQKPEARLAVLQTAVSFYHGPFLSGFLVFGSDVAEEWVEAKRRRLEIIYYDALRDLTTLLEAQGRQHEALFYALRATELNAEDETAREQALRLAASRNRDEGWKEESPANETAPQNNAPQMAVVVANAIESLSKSARLLLIRLAVFQGGWTDELAAQVLDAPVPPALRSALEAAHLVHSDQAVCPTRYAMPDAVREAALNLLTRREKRKVFLAYARRLLQMTNSPVEKERIQKNARYEPPTELLSENILAALHWTLREGNAPQMGVQLALNQCPFWHQANDIAAMRFWLECALGQEHRLSSSVRFHLHYALGTLWHHLYDQTAALRRFDAALQYAKTLGQQEQVARAFDALGKTAHHLEQDVEARAAFEAGLAVCAEQESLRPVKAWLSSDYAEALAVQGETKQALSFYAQSLVLAAAANDTDLHASVLYRFAELLHEQGNLMQALNYADQSLIMRQARNEELEVAACLRLLGALHLDQGHFGEARFFLECSAEIFARFQRDECRAATLGWLGELEHRMGGLEAAARYYQEGLDVWQRKPHQRWCGVFKLRQACLAYHQGADALATALCAEASSHCPGTHALKTRAGILQLQARLALRKGALEDAQNRAEESLAIFRRVENGAGVIAALETLAEVALLGEDKAAAFRFFSEARVKRNAMSMPVPPVEATAYVSLQKQMAS